MKAKAYTMGKVRPKMQESKKKVENGVKSTKAVQIAIIQKDLVNVLIVPAEKRKNEIQPNN